MIEYAAVGGLQPKAYKPGNEKPMVRYSASQLTSNLNYVELLTRVAEGQPACQARGLA